MNTIRRSLLTILLLFLAVTSMGALRLRPISQAQTKTVEDPQLLFLHPITAPNPALAQPVPVRAGAAPQDAKEVALAFVAGQTGASIATAPSLSWAVESSAPLDSQRTLIRMSQFKERIPVFGAQLAIQVKGDTVLSVAGTYVPSIAAGAKPTLSAEAAYKIARLALAPGGAAKSAVATHAPGVETHVDTIAKPVLGVSELVFFNPAMFDAGPPLTALSYRLVVDEADGSASMTVLVDAMSGKVLLRYSNFEGAKNRVIRDANGAQSTSAPNCYTESGPVGNPGAECVAAFQNTGATYDYYLNTFNRDSFNNSGATMIAVVRYGTVANAFWNGTLTSFGPGFATRDVVGHEWTHAVTQYTAGLIYSNQSGAMNESMSDIFGAMIDRDDWLMGEDTPVGALRSLANPPQFGDPDRVSNYSCTTSDSGGVHTNSGIPNKLAYLISEGGTFNGRTITGIGRGPTERIFYRTLTTYLTPSSTFAQLYNGVRSAATDLFGAGSAQFTATETAAQAVELNIALPCGGSVAPDSFEPDNSVAEAKPIATNGTAQNHNFHQAGDQDWLSFGATSGSTYQIQTLNLQSNADTVLTLYSTDGSTVLAENDDDGGISASRIAWTATGNGTFFVRVRHYSPISGGANNGYQVRITASAPPPTPDAFEPDDSQGAAKPITVGGAAQDHTFHVAGDQDWVRFSASAGAIYVIETFDLGSTSDTVLSLYDGNAALLAENDDYNNTAASHILWTAPANGTFFARVRHYDSAAAGATTSYRLRVTVTLPPGDAFEDDDTLATARPIDVDGAAQTHTIHVPGDEDWVSFAISPGNDYVVETFDLAAGTDTVLALFNSASTLLAENDDFNGLASRVGYSAGSAETLYARVTHFSSAAGGSSLAYSLRVTSTPNSGADTFEPDNSAAQARAVTPNDAPRTHTFHVAGDQDWVSFPTTAGNSYVLATSNLENRSDTIIDLIGGDGTSVLVSDDDSGPGVASLINWVAPDSATYFARVRHYDSGTGGPGTGYDLRITTEGTSGAPDAYEDDDSRGLAQPITVNGASQDHNFDVAGDQDWVSFQAQSGIRYTMTTSNLGTHSDTVLELYDSNSQLLASNDDSNGLASQIEWDATANEQYFLKVHHFASDVGGANTEYTLQVVSSGGDAFEPDDAPANARPITTDGAPQTHTFHVPADQDWATFSVAANTIYTLATANLGVCGDTVLELYDSSSTLLAANDDFNGLASRIVYRAPGNDTYYLKVRHYSPGASGACTSYDLAATAEPGGDAYEPDDTLNDARPLTVNGATQTHNFHVANDYDWVSFPASGGTIYTIATSNLGGCSDTVVSLYDGSGTLLAENDDFNGTYASRIVWPAAGNDTFFIRVRHYSSSASGDCTSYDLAASSNTVTPDAYEPDDSAAAAKVIGVGSGSQQHNFHSVDDQDWVQFSASGGIGYTISTFDLEANSDTMLELYDSSLTLLEANDDYGGSLASRIMWTAPGNGTYFVRVRPYSGTGGRASTGYSLAVAVGAAARDGMADAPVVQVQADSGLGLPQAALGALRLTGAQVEGSFRVGDEFTTVVLAEGSAASYKLTAGAKSEYLQLVAIQPLTSSGAPFDVEASDPGSLWQAQQVGQFDLAVTSPWSANSPTPLVALRWRIVSVPMGIRVLALPIQVMARDGGGQLWDAGTARVIIQAAGGLKIESVEPDTIYLVGVNSLSIRATGLTQELPKVYLVTETLSLQLVNVSFAPESSDTLLVEVPDTTKPGTYKVRLVLSDSTEAVSDTPIRLLPASEPTATATVTATTKPATPTPTTTPSPTVGPGERRRVYLPLLHR